MNSAGKELRGDAGSTGRRAVREAAQRSPRVLIIRLDYLGDMLCTTALMSAIRHKYPDGYLAVLAHSYNRLVIADNPDIDAVFQYIFSRERQRNPRPGWIATMLDRVKLLFTLRAIHFDYVIIPNGGRYMSSVQFAWQLGAKHVCFIDDDLAFDDRIPEHALTRPLEHEVVAGFRVARELLGDVRPEDYRLQLHIPATAKGKLGERFPRKEDLITIGLNFSARVPERVWSVANWCRLAVRLAEQAQVVVFGAPEMWGDEAFKGEAAASGLLALAGDDGRAMLWPTQTFLDLAAAIADCDMLVSTDGGAVHVAAALQKPVVVLFENRPEKYRRWYPWGVEYAAVVSKTSTEVAGIAVEDALAACLQLQAKMVAAAPAES